MTTQFVSSGVTSSGAVVTSGNTLEVLSGGTANATNVNSGDIQQVDAGGLASATLISSGGTDLVFGSDTHDQVLAGGIETIGSGGVVSAVTGSGLFTADSGTLNVLAGGTLYNAGVYSGAQLNISSGGTAASLGVSGGGVLNLAAGGTADGFSVSSGGLANVLGTSLSNTRIASGGLEIISSGGIVSGALSSGNSISGAVDVLSGGTLALPYSAAAPSTYLLERPRTILLFQAGGPRTSLGPF
jgi:autotransporter passenger strand-loop-strand repeat protein